MSKPKKIAFYSICILLLGFALPLSAQRVSTFQVVVPGHIKDYNSFPKSIIPLPDKGFIGYCLVTYSTPSFNLNFPVIFRLDSLGREVWIKRYFTNPGLGDENNITSFQFTTSLVRVSDSVFAFALATEGGDSTVLTEIDNNGRVLWTKDYDIKNFTGFYSFAPTSLTTTPNGGLLIAGGLFLGHNDEVLLGAMGLISVNDTGGVEWAKTYVNRSDSNYYNWVNFHVNRVINSPGGGYLVNGIKNNGIYQNGRGTNDSVLSFVYKVSANGALLWHKCYGFPEAHGLFGKAESYQGNSDITNAPGAIYIASQDTAGYFLLPKQDSVHSISILKLDTSGSLRWVRGYSKMEGAGISLLYDSVKNSLMLSSYIDTLSYTISPPGMFLARLDTAGNFKYIHLFSNISASLGTGFYGGDGNICKTPNGYAMIGENGIPNLCVVKTDLAGLTNSCDTRNVVTRMHKETFTQHIQSDSTMNMDVKVFQKTKPGVFLNLNTQVLCEPFVASFGWQDTCAGTSTTFNDSTYEGPKYWIWNFGDPASGSSNISYYESPNHSFNKPGTYKVKLVVSNGANTDSITRLVHIAASPHAFKVNDTICVGDSIKLVADTGGIHYGWNSAVVSDSTRQSVWAYPYEDTVLAVTVTNIYGCSNIDSFRVKVPSNCPGISKASGIINKYASVLSIDSCLNQIIVDTASLFKQGDSVLLIQMKGATIDTTNDSTFGVVKNIGSAGLYEYNRVDSIGGHNVFLKYKFQNQYEVSGNIQLVTIPQYTNLLITDTLKAMPWNGAKGGVVILNATGIVIMGAPISVSGQGFLGGVLDSGGTTCHKSDYYYSNTSFFGANKGEGLAVTKPTLSRGRGANANGGGGGDSYEAGGGGGANAGAGGQGGKELANCGSAVANGGIGGFNLNNYTGQDRLFMGGGGGAGFYHNISATPGSNGGGIIVLSVAKLACNGNGIIASGATQATRAVFDAAGGGGGGGSVVFNVRNLAMNTPVSVNGGGGGNDSFRFCQGTGGGGGAGTLQLTSNGLPGNIIFSDSGGLPGQNLSSLASCYKTSYGADAGQKGVVVTGVSVSHGNKLFTRPYTTIFSASVTDSNHIQLSFEKSVNPYVTAYKIYRKINNGTYANIATISQPVSSLITYDDVINTAKDSFSYHVYTVDTCGDVSNYSSTHTTIHLHDTIIGCEQAIHLNWNPYAGWPIKKYEVYRTTNGGTEILFATLKGSVTSFKDSTANYHNQYCYRVLAYDSVGSYTSWSEKTCGRTYFLDSAKIITVTKTSTSTTNGTIVIRWQNTAGQRYMSGTQLYYSANGKSYNLLAILPSTQDSFVQTGINTKSADGYYYIKNIDSCGTASDSSIINKTMTLTVSVGQLLHKLNWTPYYGFKIKRYKIERLEKGVFVIIDSVPGTDTASKEFPAPCNYDIFYRIEAEGYNSGELSWSDTIGRKAIDIIPPNSAKIKDLTVLGTNNIRINFISSDSLDVYKYVVERMTNGGSWVGKDFITSLHGASATYIDTINTISNQICYTIITLDSCLNAAQSDTICSEALTSIGLSCKAQVTLALPKIISPPSKPDSFVIYRSLDSINYNKINQLPVTDLVDLDTNVTAGTQYYYKLATVYDKAAMISYSVTISAVPKTIPEADTAQLVYATVLKSDETSGEIYIRWRRAVKSDTNARGYYVYSFSTANGKYALIKDVPDLNDTTYIQNNINTLKNAYKYYIITYNVCDVGINSKIHKTVLLNVQNNNLNEQLNWNNYFGIPIKSYSVYKSKDGSSQNLVFNGGLDSSFSDSNVNCNHSYTYQIQAMLANGEISFSDSITVKSFDTIRPKTEPIILAAVTRTGITDGRISLSWNASTDNNLKGYNIYRSDNGFGWILIRLGYVGTSMIDTAIDTYDQSYYYKIQPVDSCGNVGPFTIYHETIHLKARADNGYNQLNWSSYSGWKVKKYLVYKDGVLIDTLSNDVLAFKDSAVICNTVYQYLVKAIDSSNDTILSASNTDSAKALNHTPPQKVYIKTVSVSKPNKAATIAWTPSKSYDVKNYAIYRKSAVTGAMQFIGATVNTSFVDSSFMNNSGITEPDCYYVFTTDNCGNQSDASNQGCIILLNTDNQPGYNQLSWNSYQDWPDGVRSYNVYKNEDSLGWQLIGTTSSVQVNEFQDKKLGDSTIDFCYQVEAIENPGQYNQLSRSTVECVHQDATVFIPNSFTPYDQNLENDLFGPIGIHIKNYSMKIYNRWGELVYNTISSKAWDGTSHGQFVQQGVYIYIITVTDYNGKQSYLKGTITMFE